MSVQWRAPGRVNLIGEHTDYNDGFVLPFALDAGCTATVAGRPDGVVSVRSRQFDSHVEVDVDSLAADHAPDAEWAAYPLGAVWALRERGVDVAGLDVTVDGNVPAGAGLSSSAALVCSVARAVDELFDGGLDADALLAATRSAENDFVGAPTGGMDQLAALRCVADHALLCDMRALTTEAVPLPLADHGLVVVVVDSRAPHRHSDGEYRRRRESCERAAAALGVPALRDIALDDLDDALARLPDEETRRRARHVVTENDRVLRAAALLREGDLTGIGPLLDESHTSMRQDYEITVPVVDLIAHTLREHGAHGARMTGGGFGGCVIGLFDADAADDATAAVSTATDKAGFDEPTSFTVHAAAGGAHRLTDPPNRSDRSS